MNRQRLREENIVNEALCGLAGKSNDAPGSDTVAKPQEGPDRLQSYIEGFASNLSMQYRIGGLVLQDIGIRPTCLQPAIFRFALNPQAEEHLDVIVEKIAHFRQQVAHEGGGLGCLAALEDDDVDAGVTNIPYAERIAAGSSR